MRCSHILFGNSRKVSAACFTLPKYSIANPPRAFACVLEPANALDPNQFLEGYSTLETKIVIYFILWLHRIFNFFKTLKS